jgi:hypothetical protein
MQAALFCAIALAGVSTFTTSAPNSASSRAQ